MGIININLPRLGDALDIFLRDDMRHSIKSKNETKATHCMKASMKPIKFLQLIVFSFALTISSQSFSATVDVVNATSVQADTIPIPSAIWLFGAALVGFIGISRRNNV